MSAISPVRVSIYVTIILATVLSVTELASNFLNYSDDIKAVIATAFLSVFTLVYNNNQQKSRESKSRHFEERRKAYQIFFDLISSMVQNSGTEKAPSEDRMISETKKVMKELLVWGSAETINAFNEWQRFAAGDNHDPREVNRHIDKILRAMRKDLGHEDFMLEKRGLMKIFVKGSDHGVV